MEHKVTRRFLFGPAEFKPDQWRQRLDSQRVQRTPHQILLVLHHMPRKRLRLTRLDSRKRLRLTRWGDVDKLRNNALAACPGISGLSHFSKNAPGLSHHLPSDRLRNKSV